MSWLCDLGPLINLYKPLFPYMYSVVKNNNLLCRAVEYVF